MALPHVYKVVHLRAPAIGFLEKTDFQVRLYEPPCVPFLTYFFWKGYIFFGKATYLFGKGYEFKVCRGALSSHARVGTHAHHVEYMHYKVP